MPKRRDDRPPSEHQAYVLWRMAQGEELRSHQGIRGHGWWSIGSAGGSKTIDARDAGALKSRGLIRPLPYVAGKFYTAYVLTEEGAAAAAAAPPPAAGYMTPKELRNAASDLRVRSEFAASAAAAARRAALATAERAVVDAAVGYFDQKATFEQLEEAVAALRRARSA